MIIKKIVTSFITPPGIFITAMLFYLAVLLVRKRFRACLVIAAAAIIVWAISITPVSDFILSGLTRGIAGNDFRKGDVIVLLGGGLSSSTDGSGEIFSPNSQSMARLAESLRLHRKTGLTIIASGGGVYEHVPAEGPILGRYLKELGIAGRSVIIEDASRDTHENAKYCTEICRARGYKRPIIITSSYHMRRAMMAFRYQGMKVIPWPVGHIPVAGREYRTVDFLPRSMDNLSSAVREYIGIIYYGLFLQGLLEKDTGQKCDNTAEK